MSTQCPKCNSENTDTARFCSDCGIQLISQKDIPAQTRTIETPVQELTRGTTFANRYEIIEELGTGGMGKVYRVEDMKAKEEIALKLIKPEIVADIKTIDRFRNELTTARKIRHKNICGMYHLGEDKGSYYITMEYVPGEDLKSFLRRSKKLTVETTVSIGIQICDGLSEAHRMGVIHRDLKPSNIMIDREGNARIMDFGIARSLKGKGITGPGVMIGTPEYMSPEQVEGKEIDQRTDIYSFGVIIYEMVTGRVPFEGDTALTIAVRQKTEEPKDPREFNTQLSEDLSRVILKCLEKDKGKRYQSIDQILDELSEIERSITTTERILPKKEPEITKTGDIEWKDSIAVLPFVDLSAQKDQEYFCDGMAEELINALSKIEKLHVASRTSSFQ
ncbi:MAG: protein kinase, partial [Candidatus Aminicenantes bacterium]|nr:protein kinase [Candidatus Aminicenantes bacterium]